MIIQEVIDIIRFNTATLSELSGKSLNNLFSTRNIVRQLMYALDKYAKVTLSIQDYYSIPIDSNTQYITSPPLALRSSSYVMAFQWIDGQRYPILPIDPNKFVNEFNYQGMTGIPIWLMPWKDLIYLQARTNSNYNSSSLSKSILSSDSTIEVDDGSNFLEYEGRITIDSEKIYYRYRSENYLYDCVRGAEQTIASSHSKSSIVKENNFHILYNRLHTRIIVNSDNFIDKIYANAQIEVPDEHIEMITDYATYKLLAKIDVNKAAIYKNNFDEWLEKTKYEIAKGRSNVNKTGEIRGPYFFEEEIPGYLL